LRFGNGRTAGDVVRTSREIGSYAGRIGSAVGREVSGVPAPETPAS
jgi:hypothetical protein